MALELVDVRRAQHVDQALLERPQVHAIAEAEERIERETDEGRDLAARREEPHANGLRLRVELQDAPPEARVRATDAERELQVRVKDERARIFVARQRAVDRAQRARHASKRAVALRQEDGVTARHRGEAIRAVAQLDLGHEREVRDARLVFGALVGRDGKPAARRLVLEARRRLVRHDQLAEEDARLREHLARSRLELVDERRVRSRLEARDVDGADALEERPQLRAERDRGLEPRGRYWIDHHLSSPPWSCEFGKDHHQDGLYLRDQARRTRRLDVQMMFGAPPNESPRSVSRHVTSFPDCLPCLLAARLLNEQLADTVEATSMVSPESAVG